MKTAIPSNDGENISVNFERSRGFIIFETHEGSVLKVEFRDNNTLGITIGHFKRRAKSEDCKEYAHRPLPSALNDCDAVITSGLGQCAITHLRSAGKKVFFTSERNARKALELLTKGHLNCNEDFRLRNKQRKNTGNNI